MKTFREWSETKNPPVYHITYLRNVKDIFQSQLAAAGGFSAWLKPHLQQHSAKGVFFCQTTNCAKYWIDALIEQAFTHSDHPIQDEMIPVVLKFKLNRNSWTSDSLGNADAQASNFYTNKTINPAGILVWDGKKWSSDPDDAENLKYWFASLCNASQDAEWGDNLDNFHSDEYPYPTIW